MNAFALWRNKVRTPEELVQFVNETGFCTINVLEGLPAFPSQEEAMGREDVLGYTWFWKDDLHVEKHLFYTRLFRRQPGYLAMEWVPVFIATNGRPADELIFQGKMTAAAREIYEVIERQGPISSKDLRPVLSESARKSKDTSLIELERRFIVTKVGITGRERETYSYIWDLTERWIPEAFEEADRIGEMAAARRIVSRLQDFDINVTPSLLTWLLGWETELASKAIAS